MPIIPIIRNTGGISNGTSSYEKIIHTNADVLSFTNTAEGGFNAGVWFYKNGEKYLRVLIGLRGDGSNTVYMKLYIDDEASPRATITETSSEQVIHDILIDISDLPDGVHNITPKGYVDGGTGYFGYYDVRLKT